MNDTHQAFWVDVRAIEQLTGQTIAELLKTDVLNDFTPDANERRLLVLLRTGDTEQRLRALEQLKKLYIGR